MKILNLYAGIGGNRKLWEGHDVTAVEFDPNIAAIYKSHFPEDEVIVGDAHEILLTSLDSFDFIWCADGLWLGSIKEGFIAEEPYAIIDEMVRITKNKGTIAIVFWSSQKILPGYPLIESSLNATLTANRALYPGMEPELHFMKASSWLKKAGLQNIQSRTFASDIKNFPLNLASMFWGRAEQEVSPEVWGKYKKISDKDSEEYPFNNDDYTGFLTYTMFTGQVSK